MANNLTSLDAILPLLGPASNRGTKALHLHRHLYGISQNHGREVALAHYAEATVKKTWLCEFTQYDERSKCNPSLMLLQLKETR
ncbi:hypothetical protein B0G69_6338 [Paraburkholderia sp. RAU2J]|uniref:hypothetical protein n=1 Tax=Paraburkholderia sp. RAU2J TaxID=1938810 RepID=UPI000F1CF7F2|nr:hypothetical protein [Paraburkholderia sp. RAU2J]RKT22849.1 hypothetical protein B0G69_6338 [Paraburkholderia sp. RAU2J]